MAYGFNDDKSKINISQTAYTDKITLDGSSANFSIAHSALAVQGSVAYINLMLKVKSATTANQNYVVPIKLPNNLKLLRVFANTEQAISSNDYRFKGGVISGRTGSFPTLPNKDVITFATTEGLPKDTEFSILGVVMLQG